jgi:hypothetical protein
MAGVEQLLAGRQELPLSAEGFSGLGLQVGVKVLRTLSKHRETRTAAVAVRRY